MEKTHPPADWSFYHKHGLAPLINVSGTMTSLGASIAAPGVADAMAEYLQHFIDMHELQARASTAIAGLTGAEAGFVTASSSAGITLAVAAAITGLDAARASRLPGDPGERNQVVIQAGHLCNYGAPVAQAIALAGAQVVPVGSATHVLDHELKAALCDCTAAAVFVVSHHAVDYLQMPLEHWVALCHARNVPVIVDAASEYDLTGFLAQGADIAIYSGHKFLGGPTAGLVAGNSDLIRAAYLQNIGIGRGMKVGKESIAGAIAALEAWKTRDHAAIRKSERAALALWREAAGGFEGVTTTIAPDPTGNPLDRLKIRLDPARAGASAAGLAMELAAREPKIITRDDQAGLGYIQLDPCNLAPGHAPIVAARLSQALGKARDSGLASPDPNELRNVGVTGYLNWPG